MEDFQLPTKVEFNQEDPTEGRVVISPLERGYGHTIGNAYRRVLLSSLPGGAVESVKIEGAQHEFTTVEGVLEDVIEIILNLKELAVKVHSDESFTLELSEEGKGKVTAADIEDSADLEIINEDHEILTLVEGGEVDMEITFGPGKGYVQSDEKNTEDWPIGTIAVDSHYSPIRDVGYDVEKTRVGDITDYDEVTINIETDGTITIEEAMEIASDILEEHFDFVGDAAEEGGLQEETEEEQVDSEDEDETKQQEEPSSDWLKDDLIDYAEDANIPVNSSMNKGEILDKIEKWEQGPKSSWLKDELIEYAEAQGVDVEDGDTKKDILDKIE
ncbi:MAG: DNA-directed RNA polymerase subunit alpha [Candidatus Paceibacteria bacterium]